MQRFPIDFLIITALPEERDAVLAKFPGFKKTDPSPEDIRVYYEAEIPVETPNGDRGLYHVVVTGLLGMGRVQAATATEDAIRRWHPRYILLVGIAGGIKEKGVDLGDVLVSDQVVDYELQKLTPDGPQIRWQVYRTDPRLLIACQNLSKQTWLDLVQVERPITGNAKLKIGPVASGDKVIAYGTAMEQYREHWVQLLGIEMEASGVATASFQSVDQPGFLMVRGVSDFADEGKGTPAVESWRPYACDVAASFSLALLKSCPAPLSILTSSPGKIDFKNYLNDLMRIEFSDKIVDQNVVQIFVREIDLAGIRKDPVKPIAFSEFKNDSIFGQGKNILITGEAGIGKTTELLKIVKQAACEALENENSPTPIYIELRKFISKSGDGSDLLHHIQKEAKFPDDSESNLISLFNSSKRFLFIFDGLNEIQSEFRSTSINALLDFIGNYSAHQYVLSTRYYGFDDHFLNISKAPITCYELQRWEKGQIEIYFQANGVFDLFKELSVKVQKLCSIPFAAHLLMNILQSQQYDSSRNYPQNKAELYRSYVEYIFNRRDQRLKNEVDPGSKNSILAAIAYTMNRTGTLNIKYKDLCLEMVQKGYLPVRGEAGSIRSSSGEIASEFTNAVKEIIRNGILLQGQEYFLSDLRAETPIEFVHQSFQEYFSALYISLQPEQELTSYLPIHNLGNLYWRDVPIYLVGLVGNPIPFIEILLSQDHFEDYLLVAAQCLVSCQTQPAAYHKVLHRIIDDGLIQSIQNAGYTKDAIDIVETLGEPGVNILLSHLDEVDEIIKVRALTNDEQIERKWRKYGRIIYILGELNVFSLIAKLEKVYRQVQDVHLLYHIAIALHTLKHEEAGKVLADDFFTNHPDPVLRTFAFLARNKHYPQGSEINTQKSELILALMKNIQTSNPLAFAIRAHSAEALGLLGEKEAIEPLASLLEVEVRSEPQSSALKALGYIAEQHNNNEINQRIIAILLGALLSGKVDGNPFGKKIIKQILSNLCTKQDLKILKHAMEEIEQEDSTQASKQIKREILEELILQFRS